MMEYIHNYFVPAGRLETCLLVHMFSVSPHMILVALLASVDYSIHSVAFVLHIAHCLTVCGQYADFASKGEVFSRLLHKGASDLSSSLC